MAKRLVFAGVELRTTHAHGVEVALSAAERAEVKKRFADSEIELVGLGSAFEYDAVDPQILRSHIDGNQRICALGPRSWSRRSQGAPQQRPRR